LPSKFYFDGILLAQKEYTHICELVKINIIKKAENLHGQCWEDLSMGDQFHKKRFFKDTVTSYQC